MDLKTNKRIAAFKAKERERRASNKQPMTNAERAYKMKQKEAKKRRPGFGSSCRSVADHLNEVVGLTERQISKREERDRRIEAAAKSGAGCRRFEVAAANSGATKFFGKGQSLTTASKTASKSRPRAPGTTNTLGGTNTNHSADVRDARAAFLARLQSSNQES